MNINVLLENVTVSTILEDKSYPPISLFILMSAIQVNTDQPVKFVSFQYKDRQWDARFNVPLGSDITELIQSCKQLHESGKASYIFVGGIEIGDKSWHSSFEVKHVHCCFIMHNLTSKRAMLNSLNIKVGNGYYLVPRNRDYPYSGWKAHHAKKDTKVDPSNNVLLELGVLPADIGKTSAMYTKRSDEEKKRKIDEILIDMRTMIEDGQDKEAWAKYPRTFLQYGEKIKAMVMQTKDKLKSDGHPHIWLHGAPGIGKSAIMSYVYPKTFKKNLYNQFFDLYDPAVHTHVMLEDLDHDAIDRLSLNFVKTLCDEAGFAIDQKYKTPQLARSSILVTSNFTVPELVKQSDKQNSFGHEEHVKALLRRFWHIEIVQFLSILNLKLLPSFDVMMLKKEGNTDPGRLFISWDYKTDTPLCTPIQSPEFYQKLIKDTYYH